MKEKKQVIYHIISLFIISTSIIFAIFYFENVWSRVWQAVKDLGSSVMWILKGRAITPTVNTLPPNAVGVLPFNFSDFKVKLKEFGKLFIDWSNIKGFFFDVAIWILLVLCVIIPLALLLFSMWLDGKKRRRRKKKVVHNFNQETKPLRIFKKVEGVVWDKPKAFFKGYKDFVFDAKYYVVIFCVIWGIALNFGTIAIELVAYVLYLCRGFDLSKIYLQFAKLAMDLTVAVDFVPHVVWVYVGLKKFDKWRKKLGIERLRDKSAHNTEFLEAHGRSIFITGKQRMGKSTIAQSMSRRYNTIARDNALKGMQKREKQFPDFPWVNVVRTYREAQEKHALPKLESWRHLIHKLELRFKYIERYNQEAYTGNMTVQQIVKLYKKLYGYHGDNLLFGYDVEKYSLIHNDGLVYVEIFKALADYAQEFHIYAERTSLIMSNSPIRCDLIWEDYGNFPVYDSDCLNREPEDIYENSQYSHIMQWDALRLGKLVWENNPYKDGYEYGCISIMEMAKDRGNQISNRGLKVDDEKANPNNDLFELNMKIKGHEATIDNYTYFWIVMDDQRPDDLGANNKDLCDIVMISQKTERKMLLPFYAFEEVVGLVANNFYDKWELDKKVLRGDRTLREYLVKKVFLPIYNHCERLENKFSVEGRRLKIWDGMTEDLLSEKSVYWIIYAEDYNDRFTTNSLQAFYSAKAHRSKYGLGDYKCFNGREMTKKEMRMMGSYLYIKLFKIFENEGNSKKAKRGV